VGVGETVLYLDSSDVYPTLHLSAHRMKTTKSEFTIYKLKIIYFFKAEEKKGGSFRVHSR
jgi:hypothetical protein